MIEKLTRGSILGVNMVLIKGQNKVKAVCTTSVILHSIEHGRLLDLIKNDEPCFRNLESVIDKILKVPEADRFLDFIQIHRCLKMAASSELVTGERAVRASQLIYMLKNVVMQMIHKNRETRKVPKLKDILKQSIANKQR